MRLSGVNVSTINIIIHALIQKHSHPSGNMVSAVHGSVCLLSQVSQIDQMMEKLFHIHTYVRLHAQAHTHTHSIPQKRKYTDTYVLLFIIVLICGNAILNVCANSSQIRVLGNRGASYAFRSVLRQPSLCKHLSPCILFSAILKIAFDFFVFIRSNFFFCKIIVNFPSNGIEIR